MAGLAPGLVGGLVVGAVRGANAGGWYLFLQQRVRRNARRRSLLPHDPETFVRAAIDAGILRRAGGGVQFRHRLLADHLVEDAPTPGLADLREQAGRDRTGVDTG